MNKAVAISQSNYIPWRGYFSNIKKVDHFVLFDTVQYTKRDWRNRNKIRSNDKSIWLTVPVSVKGKFFQSIEDTKVIDFSWKTKHLNSIYHSYRKASSFEEYFPLIEDIYAAIDTPSISSVNEHLIRSFCKILNIDTRISQASDFKVSEDDRNNRLIELCKKTNSNVYYSGPSAQSYLDKNLFNKKGVEVKYFDYQNLSNYQQIHGTFEPYVSVVDLLLNMGAESSNFI